MTRLRLLLALSCCASLLLSGCSDSSSSSSADPPSPSPTSSSAAPSPTEEPETAEEFVRRWVELNTQMQNTGETGAFAATCPKSASCQRLVQLVRSYYEAGGYLKTGRWEVVKMKVVGGEGRNVQLDADIRSAPTEYKKSADSPLDTFAGGLTRNQFFLRRTKSGWLIQEWTQTA